LKAVEYFAQDEALLTGKIFMKNSASSLFATAILCLGLIAEAFGQNADTTPIRIVIVPKSTDNPFFDPSGDGCKDQAALLTRSGDRKVTCEYIGPGPAADDNDGKIQAQIVMDLITNGTVDALSISVRDSAAMAPAIQMAHDKGIPVVTFDSDAPESLRSAFKRE
jgi:ribose transport system substrate-binding protein